LCYTNIQHLSRSVCSSPSFLMTWEKSVFRPGSSRSPPIDFRDNHREGQVSDSRRCFGSGACTVQYNITTCPQPPEFANRTHPLHYPVLFFTKSVSRRRIINDQ